MAILEPMPEGNIIHRLARDLAAELTGERVRVVSPSGKFVQASLLDGGVVTGARAIGKHLLIDFEDDRALHLHLGRFGKLRRHPLPHADAKAHARLRMTSASAVWELIGAIQCDLYDAQQIAALRERVGGDPLAGGPAPKSSWKRFHGSRRSVGALLLDQSIFAGVGNIYRAEILFMLGIDPHTRGCDVDRKTFAAIWSLARKLLRRGVEANRIITVDGATARTPRRKALHVYKQRRCAVCASAIAKEMSGARVLYYCPRCQKASSTPKARPSLRDSEAPM